MRSLSTQLRLYIVLMAGLGAGLVGLSVTAHPLELAPLTIALAVVLTALIALAGAYPMHLSPKVKANVTTAPLFKEGPMKHFEMRWGKTLE